MASRTVTRKFADGTQKEFRRPIQGRKASGLPLKTAGVLVHMTEADKAEFAAFCRECGMTESRMGELVLLGYMRDIQLSVTDNC